MPIPLESASSAKRESAWFARLPWLALALLVCLLLGFASRFSREFERPDAWGQLGDFVGGTLNPILAFLSLLVLLKTMREQRKQVHQLRQHAVLEELQRLMTSVSVALDEVLRRPVAESSPLLTLNRSSWGIERDREFLRSATRAGLSHLVPDRLLIPTTLARTLEDVRLYLHWDYSKEIFWAIRTELADAREQLKRLDWCLGEFLNNGGAPVIAHFYGVQYRTVALVTAALADSPNSYGQEAANRLGLGAELRDLLDTMSTVRSLRKNDGKTGEA